MPSARTCNRCFSRSKSALISASPACRYWINSLLHPALILGHRRTAKRVLFPRAICGLVQISVTLPSRFPCLRIRCSIVIICRSNASRAGVNVSPARLKSYRMAILPLKISACSGPTLTAPFPAASRKINAINTSQRSSALLAQAASRTCRNRFLFHVLLHFLPPRYA